MVFVIERPGREQSFVILLSAIPIALIVNIVRITVTGLLYMAAGPDNIAVQKICHDYAGLVIMMPLCAGAAVVGAANPGTNHRAGGGGAIACRRHAWRCSRPSPLNRHWSC